MLPSSTPLGPGGAAGLQALAAAAHEGGKQFQGQPPPSSLASGATLAKSRAVKVKTLKTLTALKTLKSR